MKARHALQVLSLAAVLASCGAQKREEVAGCPSTRPDEVGHDAAGARVTFVIDVVEG